MKNLYKILYFLIVCISCKINSFELNDVELLTYDNNNVVLLSYEHGARNSSSEVNYNESLKTILEQLKRSKDKSHIVFQREYFDFIKPNEKYDSLQLKNHIVSNFKRPILETIAKLIPEDYLSGQQENSTVFIDSTKLLSDNEDISFRLVNSSLNLLRLNLLKNLSDKNLDLNMSDYMKKIIEILQHLKDQLTNYRDSNLSNPEESISVTKEMANKIKITNGLAIQLEIISKCVEELIRNNGFKKFLYEEVEDKREEGQPSFFDKIDLRVYLRLLDIAYWKRPISLTNTELYNDDFGIKKLKKIYLNETDRKKPKLANQKIKSLLDKLLKIENVDFMAKKLVNTFDLLFKNLYDIFLNYVCLLWYDLVAKQDCNRNIIILLEKKQLANLLKLFDTLDFKLSHSLRKTTIMPDELLEFFNTHILATKIVSESKTESKAERKDEEKYASTSSAATSSSLTSSSSSSHDADQHNTSKIEVIRKRLELERKSKAIENNEEFEKVAVDTVHELNSSLNDR